MFRIIVAGFKHETNTFAADLTDLEAFRKREYLLDEEIIEYYADTATEIGGFLRVLTGQPDVELLPVVAANAMPAGPVTLAVVEDVHKRLIGTIQSAGRVDAVLLSLHGAMVTEGSHDGEGGLLEAVRGAVGEAVPVMATLDLHSNYTDKMHRNATALFHFDYYPHTDMGERGEEAARVLLATLRGQIRPVMRRAYRPLLLACVTTLGGAMKRFVDMAHRYEHDPRVISVSISHGFFCADIADLGVSVVAVTDDDAALAQAIADRIADEMWATRAELLRKLYTAEEAIEEARRVDGGPVVLSDGSDNPGGGSPCDGTHLLRAMLERKVENAAVAWIYDPESVALAERSGVRAQVGLRLGGKERPEILGEPIECTAYVRSLHDGRYVNKGSMSKGLTVDLIKSAVLVIDGIEVIVVSNRAQPWDLQAFRAHGIEPREKKLLVVKSTVHFRADFEPIAVKVIDVECPGLVPQDVTTLPYVHCRRPIYPLDPI